MTATKLTNDQIKTIQLEMLADIDQFCRRHQLHYVLNYGSLIGAIRHQGLIPWDDDIDLSMPREDYQRFLSLYASEQDRYRILTLETDARYYNNFAKIIDPTTRIVDHRNDKTYDSGVFIDIFPYDRFDDRRLIDQTYQWESFKLLSFSKHHNIVYGDSWVKDAIRSFFWLILKPVNPRFFAQRIERLIRAKSQDNGTLQGLLASKFKEKEIFPSGIFDSRIEVPFEHLQLYAPANYHEILTQYYGDYMVVPPLEKQVNPHELDVYKIEGESENETLNEGRT